MLPPDGRTALLDALRPPPGMTVQHAIATTFTLDLETAMTLPLAFARHRVPDPPDGVAIAAALADTAHDIDIFCQSGAVQVPAARSSLYTLLEASIHPVQQAGRLFHPKVWVIKFADPIDDSTSMRLIVLTRNLTADHSWDLCLTLDGTLGRSPQAANAPIADLIRWAVDHVVVNDLDQRRRTRIESLIEDARRTTWDLPADAESLTFHALGLGRGSIDLAGRRQLLISPFLGEAGIAAAASTPGSVVVSRQESLDAMPDRALDGLELYVLDESAALDDLDSADRGVLSGLHAKLYVAETANAPGSQRGRRTRPAPVSAATSSFSHSSCIADEPWASLSF